MLKFISYFVIIVGGSLHLGAARLAELVGTPDSLLLILFRRLSEPHIVAARAQRCVRPCHVGCNGSPCSINCHPSAGDGLGDELLLLSITLSCGLTFLVKFIKEVFHFSVHISLLALQVLANEPGAVIDYVRILFVGVAL